MFVAHFRLELKQKKRKEVSRKKKNCQKEIEEKLKKWKEEEEMRTQAGKSNVEEEIVDCQIY